ncbi:MAG TPA: choice-of-anchor K domain-containing protein [Terrimicrobiaceae bacterium]
MPRFANSLSASSTHAARGICIAILAVGMACVPQARAISFTGTSSGIFVNPTGGPGLVTTGVNTNAFTWGTGVQSPSSSLTYTGTGFAGVLSEQAFSIGSLSYFNGTVLDGTQCYSVGFQALLAFTSPQGLAQNFNFDFQLINTPNTGTDVQNADTVFLSTLLPTTTFSVDGIDYTLKLAFGSVTAGGFTEVNKFSVLEGRSASADLVGIITANTPHSVPDSGSTLAFMAMAVVGLGGLRQYLKA